eukprot:comp68018_c0_seq1/m.48058 comp68018_c0_seq1/g.48058  ORF comp68018_c0_seq1/g.48058 comp68018_c0_seq1/m.48058 type:complete len:362 (-) comp68018_c0_seq1:10-1095(-)
MAVRAGVMPKMMDARQNHVSQRQQGEARQAAGRPNRDPKPRDKNVKYELSKMEVYGFDPSIKETVLGLSWDSGCDIDAHCFTFNQFYERRGHVYYHRLEESGLKHSGDNLTGEGGGDDEQITMNFEKLPKDVEHLMFCIKVYSRAHSFKDVKGARARMFVMDSGKEKDLCSYNITEAGGTQMLVMCLVSRSAFGWKMTAMGMCCPDFTAPNCDYKSILNDVFDKAMGRVLQYKIMVVKGRDLAAKDKGGTSDPYVKVRLPHAPDAIVKTKTVKRSLNPVWDTEMDFTVKSDANLLPIEFEVYDWDMVGKHDKMGVAELSCHGMSELVDQGPQERWLKLERQYKEKVSGEILVVFEVCTAPF